MTQSFLKAKIPASMAPLPSHGLVGTGFTSRYRLQPRQDFKGQCVDRPSRYFFFTGHRARVFENSLAIDKISLAQLLNTNEIKAQQIKLKPLLTL